MLVSVSAAARELGVSTEHIRRMMRAGKWPSYKLGPKAMRLDPDEIRALGRMISEAERQGKANREGSLDTQKAGKREALEGLCGCRARRGYHH
jgi:excisionase family DNA binding protein